MKMSMVTELPQLEVFEIARRERYDSPYAPASLVGTFVKHPKCPECGSLRWDRKDPMVIEWEAGATFVADFTWVGGGGDVVVTQRVRDCIEGKLSGVRFGPVTFWQNPKLHRPKRPNSVTVPRIWLPYEGPTLWALRVTSKCHLVREASGRRLLRTCRTCGREFFDVLPNSKVVIARDSWDGSDFFTIREVGNWVFVTGAARALIEEQGFTNVQVGIRGCIVNGCAM